MLLLSFNWLTLLTFASLGFENTFTPTGAFPICLVHISVPEEAALLTCLFLSADIKLWKFFCNSSFRLPPSTCNLVYCKAAAPRWMWGPGWYWWHEMMMIMLIAVGELWLLIACLGLGYDISADRVKHFKNSDDKTSHVFTHTHICRHLKFAEDTQTNGNTPPTSHSLMWSWPFGANFLDFQSKGCAYRYFTFLPLSFFLFFMFLQYCFGHKKCKITKRNEASDRDLVQCCQFFMCFWTEMTQIDKGRGQTNRKVIY